MIGPLLSTGMFAALEALNILDHISTQEKLNQMRAQLRRSAPRKPADAAKKAARKRQKKARAITRRHSR